MSLPSNKCPSSRTIPLICVIFHDLERIISVNDSSKHVRPVLLYKYCAIIKQRRTNVCTWQKEGVCMIKEENKKEDNINIIIELLKKESAEKVSELLIFIRYYLSQ